MGIKLFKDSKARWTKEIKSFMDSGFTGIAKIQKNKKEEINDHRKKKKIRKFPHSE